MSNSSIVTDPAMFPTAFEHAVNAGDLDRLLRLYSPEARIRKSDDSIGAGVNEVRAEMQQLIAAEGELHNRLRRIFQSGDTALILVDWTLDINTPDGKRVKNQGTATNVIRLSQEHGWQMILANPQGTA